VRNGGGKLLWCSSLKSHHWSERLCVNGKGKSRTARVWWGERAAFRTFSGHSGTGRCTRGRHVDIAAPSKGRRLIFALVGPIDIAGDLNR